jgi:hypothetical protein
MRRPVVGTYIIGQTPRPDLTDGLSARFRGVDFVVVGALDGTDASYVPQPRIGGFPLETTLQDGTRVEVDAAVLEPKIQTAISALDSEVTAHLVLCAGPFPGLVGEQPLIRPFELGASVLRGEGVETLVAVVPFIEQAGPALAKWASAGFKAQVHVASLRAGMPLEARGPGSSGEVGRALVAGLSAGAGITDADAVVFDYVGISPALLALTRSAFELPVFDLGEMAINALDAVLADT